MKDLKAKDAWIFLGLFVSGLVIYTVIGAFLELLPANLQTFIEQLLGYSIIPFFWYNGLKDFILASSHKKLQWIKYVSPINNAAYSLMYSLYLAYDFGSSHVHVSAIGFTFATIVYLFLYDRIRNSLKGD